MQNHTSNQNIEQNINISVANIHKKSFRERLSDGVAATVGSWRFIVTQSIIIIIWILFNVDIPESGLKIGNTILKPNPNCVI